MNKTIIKPPAGTRYISDWPDFESNIPQGHVILNKKATNCGATSYFLSNDKPVILCSPRKTLLRNKYEQNVNWNNEHPENLKKPLHLYRDDDSEPETKSDVGKNAGEDKGEIWKFNKNLNKYLNKNTVSPKILVTYDSLHHVIDSLGKYADKYTVVIDEMQQIFQDCTFKAETELSFINTLQNISNVVYLSATVYFEEYLDAMDEFKDLPYIEIEWDDNMLERVSMERIEMKSVVSAGCEVIDRYMKGDTHFVEINGETIYSGEAVMFINSVSDIVSIIRNSQKKYTLDNDNVNVICSICDENRKKLKKVGLDIGKVLTENEKPKQFTFVTRTCFLGCDFISTSAYTYIFATPQKDSLSLDISLDLPQIMGRQRKKENPFRNQATLYYKTSCDFKDEEIFNNELIRKYKDTQDIINGWELMNENQQQLHIALYESNIRSEHYKNNFLGIKKDKTGKMIPVINDLVALSQKRAFQIQHDNFFSDLTILKAIESTGMIDVKVSSIQTDSDLVRDCYERYKSAKTFQERMKIYCEFRGKATDKDLTERSFASRNIYNYYKILGADKIKALEYKESKIKEEYSKYGFTIQELIRDEFVMGETYLVSDVKRKIQDCYNIMGLKSTAKATDLGDYLDYKECRKDRKRAYQIIFSPKKEISLFYRINQPDNFENLDVDEVLEMIKDGTYRNEVEQIRMQTGKEMKNQLKLKLLKAATFNGTFYGRSSERLNEYSNFCALDLDSFDSEEDLIRKKTELEKVECVYSIFKSPTGMGLKVIVLHNNIRPEMHQNMMVQLMRLYGGNENDGSVKDLARGNFVSWDEGIYVNRDATPFDFKYDPNIETMKVKCKVENKTSGKKDVDSDFTESFIYKTLEASTKMPKAKRVLGILDSHFKANSDQNPSLSEDQIIYRYKIGGRHESIIKQAISLCHAGILKSDTYDYLTSNFDKAPNEIASIVEMVYSTNTFGDERGKYSKNYKK